MGLALRAQGDVHRRRCGARVVGQTEQAHDGVGDLRGMSLFGALRATEQEEAIGMDVIQHGEEAYLTGEGALLIGVGGDGGPPQPEPEPAEARAG